MTMEYGLKVLLQEVDAKRGVKVCMGSKVKRLACNKGPPDSHSGAACKQAGAGRVMDQDHEIDNRTLKEEGVDVRRAP